MKRMEHEFLRPLLKTNANTHMMVETAAGTKNDAMTITVAKQKADVVKIIRLFTRRPSGESTNSSSASASGARPPSIPRSMGVVLVEPERGRTPPRRSRCLALADFAGTSARWPNSDTFEGSIEGFPRASHDRDTTPRPTSYFWRA